MGHIDPADAEWSLMNRMKALLEQPKSTKYNVTQAIAVFSSILLWSQQRIRARHNPNLQIDRALANVRQHQVNADIVDPPWSLTQIVPESMACPHGMFVAGGPVNQHFSAFKADRFLDWLRNGFAHGDGRNIQPIHKLNAQGSVAYLGGVRVEFAESDPRGVKKGDPPPPVLVCHLFKEDLIRIGGALADEFCQQVAGQDYQNQDRATMSPMKFEG